MSITILTVPAGVESAYKPIIFELTTDAAPLDTKIQATLYYRRNPGNFWTLAAKKCQEKYLDKFLYKFNFANPLASVLSNDYVDQQVSGVYDPNENSIIEYYVKFTEKYESGGVWVDGDSLNSSTYLACNTIREAKESQSLTDYIMTTGSEKKFLTNSPDNVPIAIGEKVELHFLTNLISVKGVIKETKLDTTSVTTKYAQALKNIFRYFWPFDIDANHAVTIPDQSTYIEALATSGGSGIYNMPDDNANIWGGVRLVGTNHQIDILLPAGTLSIEILAKGVGATVNVDVSYYHSGAWQPSSTTWNIVATGYASYTHTLPTGAFTITKVRLTKTSVSPNAAYIAYGKAKWTSSNLINSRGILNVEDTVIDSDTDFIECWVENSLAAVISEVKKFTVDRRSHQNTTRFAWYNNRGGFDHHSFTAAHTEELEAQKVEFIRELQTTYSNKDRGRGTAFVQSDNVYTCFSQFEDAARLRWISEVISSQDVYLIVNDERFAIQILTSNLTPKNHNTPLQLKVSWRFANPLKVQNG